jgi:zinc finger CCHC domain-containing protein 9
MAKGTTISSSSRSPTERQSKRPSKKQTSRFGIRPKMSKEERRVKYTARAKTVSSAVAATSSRTVCYHCRKPGHTAVNCPEASIATTAGSTTSRCCYKCGSTQHGLGDCPHYQQQQQPGHHQDLPYAVCFVCKARGHLSSACPQNSNGIYVNGGECKRCGSKYHRASKCPEKQAARAEGKLPPQDNTFDDGISDGSNSVVVDNSLIPSRKTTPKKPRVVKF